MGSSRDHAQTASGAVKKPEKSFAQRHRDTTLALAFEAGYRACEKGKNLQAALREVGL